MCVCELLRTHTHTHTHTNKQAHPLSLTRRETHTKRHTCEFTYIYTECLQKCIVTFINKYSVN